MFFKKKPSTSAAGYSSCDDVALPSYNGSANSHMDTDTSTECNYEDGEQTRQSHVSKMARPLSVAILSIAFAALVSRSLSLDPHAVSSSFSALTAGIVQRGLVHVPGKKELAATLNAKDAYHSQLSEPSVKSELYHAGNYSAYVNEGGDLDDPPIPPPPEGCDATILIVRHCEEGHSSEHCGLIGFQRAEYFATLFGEGAKWPKPSYLIGMAIGERAHNPYKKNWREIETIQPLADKFGMEIDVSIGFPEKQDLTNMLFARLRAGQLCGKLTVISWKHSDMPHFATSMGCTPDDGCPLKFGHFEYDELWQIKYHYEMQKYAPYVLDDFSEYGMEKRARHPWFGICPKWTVSGTVLKEAFDPLEWAKKKGLYK